MESFLNTLFFWFFILLVGLVYAVKGIGRMVPGGTPIAKLKNANEIGKTLGGMFR